MEVKGAGRLSKAKPAMLNEARGDNVQHMVGLNLELCGTTLIFNEKSSRYNNGILTITLFGPKTILLAP